MCTGFVATIRGAVARTPLSSFIMGAKTVTAFSRTVIRTGFRILNVSTPAVTAHGIAVFRA